MDTPTVQMPASDASLAERIAFLEHQLAGAVMLLRQKDATEEACVARFEKLYASRYAAMQEQHDLKMKRLEALGPRLIASAARYDLARQHLVQIWGLGVAAQGEQLDSALDAQIKRAERKTA
jgi:hypothetical protein